MENIKFYIPIYADVVDLAKKMPPEEKENEDDFIEGDFREL